jgi:hypothetical protein
MDDRVTMTVTVDTDAAERSFPPCGRRGLVRRFGKSTAVDGLDLAIQPGEFYGCSARTGPARPPPSR